MTENYVTRRGVYKDLTLSPYEYESPYGDIFKFSSQKKLEIYARDIEKELTRFQKAMERNDLWNYIPGEILQLLFKTVYRAFYRKIEG